MSDKPKSKGRETFWAAREIGVRELDVTFPVASTNKELSRLKSCIAIANKQYQEEELGYPVELVLPPAMTDGTVQLLKAAFKAGEKVRIVPATLADDGGEVLPVTNCKDFGMIELWDDRAVQVVFNTGIRADGKEAKLWTSGAAVMWG